MTRHTLFQREILIQAPIEHVWQLVATEAGLRQWWGNPILLEAEEGGRCEEWRVGQHGQSQWQGVITLYAPPHQLIMTLRPQPARADLPELTTITIALEPRGADTLVHVSQHAFGPQAAIGRAPDTVPTHSNTQNVPLAQLDRPIPGALPMPTPAAQPGQISPQYMPLSRAQADALEAAWMTRITALAAAVHDRQ